MSVAARPLLVVDGDSFAHRAYHGLPKTIRRAGNKGGGAIVGFANYLLRLYESEQPRAVVVGWDTLSEPNWRASEFADYQGGRVFDDEIVEQLEGLAKPRRNDGVERVAPAQDAGEQVESERPVARGQRLPRRIGPLRQERRIVQARPVKQRGTGNLAGGGHEKWIGLPSRGRAFMAAARRGTITLA